MDDVLRRLGLLERDVSVIKIEVAAISAQLPNMATKEDVALLKAEVAPIRYMATKEDVALLKADVNLLKADVSDAKTSLIQWTVGTIIAVTALVFTIAKLVH
jgi:hypothetical protein